MIHSSINCTGNQWDDAWFLCILPLWTLKSTKGNMTFVLSFLISFVHIYDEIQNKRFQTFGNLQGIA